jgi:hypothetical protein
MECFPPVAVQLQFLQSDGGSVLAGIEIGEAIRLKGFQTLVVERCASACALAWLGGTQRFMKAGAQIGFHAAYDSDSRRESGVGNAMVGAYLNRIGLPYWSARAACVRGRPPTMYSCSPRINAARIAVIQAA